VVGVQVVGLEPAAVVTLRREQGPVARVEPLFGLRCGTTGCVCAVSALRVVVLRSARAPAISKAEALTASPLVALVVPVTVSGQSNVGIGVAQSFGIFIHVIVASFTTVACAAAPP